jgi:hypothetical protein
MKVTRLVVVLWLLCFAIIPAAVSRAGAEGTKALLLFGGSDHKTFLGCLNCTDTSDISVCNDVGKYGSDVAENSIWNDVGKFGSDVSPLSPWNDVSTDAPIIVDRDGNSYGYFSTNTVHHDRTRIEWLVAILDYYEKTNDLNKTHKKMCGD